VFAFCSEISERFLTLYISSKANIKLGELFMKISKKTKKAGTLVMTISIVAMVLFVVFSTMMVKPIVAESQFPAEHLFVDATYLLKTDETNESVNITCNLYLTNIWEKESGEIKAIAYVIESDNNFAVYKETVEIGIIEANSTAEIEIPIILSNNSYKVEILLFENNKLVIKGKLIINAYPVYSWRDVEHVTPGGGVTIIKEQQLDGWNIYNSASEFKQVRK